MSVSGRKRIEIEMFGSQIVENATGHEYLKIGTVFRVAGDISRDIYKVSEVCMQSGLYSPCNYCGLEKMCRIVGMSGVPQCMQSERADEASVYFKKIN